MFQVSECYFGADIVEKCKFSRLLSLHQWEKSLPEEPGAKFGRFGYFDPRTDLTIFTVISNLSTSKL